MRKLNKLLVLLIALSPATAYCQQFSHTTKLGPVTESGFYAIAVTPELSSYLDLSLKDLRIVDSKGQPVPYVVQPAFKRLKNDYFRPLPFLENELKDSGSTHLVLQNNTGHHLDALDLVVRNTATSRLARISGSDDRGTWFIVAENVAIPAGEALDKDRFRVRLNFPKSSYRFLRLIIFNGHSDPLNISEAGIAGAGATDNFTPLLSNPAPQVIQADSADGYSYIKVVHPAAYPISALRIRLNSASLYKRTMRIQEGNYAEFEISSVNDFFQVPPMKAREFRLRIYNGDNPALKVGELVTYSEAKNVIAHFNKGEQYTLFMGNPSVNAPAYDLASFTDSIPATLPVVALQQVTANLQPHAEKQYGHVTLWLIIGGVLALLGYFTWNLTREMGKSA